MTYCLLLLHSLCNIMLTIILSKVGVKQECQESSSVESSQLET